MKENFDKVLALVEEFKIDFTKVEKGNKAAAKRTRKHISEIQKLGKLLRIDLLIMMKTKEGE